MVYSKNMSSIIAISDQAWENAKKYYDWFESVAENGITDSDSGIIARKACYLVLGELDKLRLMENEERAASATPSPFNEL